MQRNQIISVRYTVAEKQALEESALLAGFDNMAAYIRERSLTESTKVNAVDHSTADSARCAVQCSCFRASLMSIANMVGALKLFRPDAGGR